MHIFYNIKIKQYTEYEHIFISDIEAEQYKMHIIFL